MLPIFVHNKFQLRQAALGDSFAIITLMSSDNISIRQLTLNEWGKFKDVRLRSVKLEPEAFGSSYITESHRTKQEWVDRLSAIDRSWLFAEDGDSVIGIIGSWQNYHNLGNDIAYIVAFFVEPSYRGKGIGKLLLKAMITQLKQNPEIHSIRLGVTMTLKKSVEFYERMGFVIIDVAKNEVQVDDKYYDEYQMELKV